MYMLNVLKINCDLIPNRDEAHGVRKRVVVRVNLEQEKIHNIVPVIKVCSIPHSSKIQLGLENVSFWFSTYTS